MSMAPWQLICVVLAAACVLSRASDEPGLQEEQSAPSTGWVAAPPVGNKIVRDIAVKSEAPAPAARRLGHHHDNGSSAAGGGVVLGGLGAAMIIAVVCYVRVTRRESAEENV